MIQIDIDMPTDCASCWIRQNMGCKIANESGWLNNKRDDRCPLKEQEAVEPTSYMDGLIQRFTCGKCGKHLLYAKWERDNFCSKCGQAVKWE